MVFAHRTNHRMMQAHPVLDGTVQWTDQSPHAAGSRARVLWAEENP